MPVTDSYATAATYRLIVSKSEAAEDTLIESDLRAMSRLVDSECGRFFTKDAAPVARVYRVPDYHGVSGRDPFFITPWNTSTALVPLAVDDIATSTGLVIRADTTGDGVFGETAWTATDYQLEPLNAPLGPEPHPYTRLAVPVWASQGGFVPGGLVQVTAVWGWPAVPETIVRWTCQLVGILRLESPRATSRVSEMGEVISTSREGQEILHRMRRAYRKGSGVVFA